MKTKPFDALVITSIAPPTGVLQHYAQECQRRGIHFIVVGDTKSPADFHLDGCDFYSITRQKSLPFRLAQWLPEKHYARKNLGYLIAWQHGARVVAETDDDNIPLESFWRPAMRAAEAAVAENTGWVNVFRQFTDAHIWPRGFPLEMVNQPVVARTALPVRMVTCMIQQGLANQNPDVDAVYRMTQPLPVDFDDDAPVAIGRGAWCPFNTQNTLWQRDAALLMYLPSWCSFRMTDIWRSFVAQRLGWECGWHVLFTAATVRQERNEHNLMRDFAEEIPGYLNNLRLCAALERLPLSPNDGDMANNLRSCYQTLVSMRLIDQRELALVDAWQEDISDVLCGVKGYW